MNIAVLTTHTLWPFHYETDLEIMQRHLDAGDEVVHLHCDSALLACDANANHDPHACRQCIARRQNGLALLSPPVMSIPFLRLTAEDRKEMAILQKSFRDLDELRTYRIDNFDIGGAVLSSMISWTRNPQPDINAPGNLLPRFLIAALSAYRSMQNYLREHPTDRVYVFNGRFAPCRAILRACQSIGVTCFVHERGHDLQSYGLFENSTLLDLARTEHQIRRLWVEAQNNPCRQAISEQFYLDRVKGIVQSWYSFTERQQAGLMPPNWDPIKRNISIFNSSEDEVESVGDEWRNPLYRNQQHGLERIIQSLSKTSHNMHIYLRVHPNLKGIDNIQTRQLATLKAEFLTVIAADDPVCTYTLMKRSDKVVTFGSTVGIEAVYWGTCSILAGQAFYRNLGGTYNPDSHEELIVMLQTDLPPKDRTAALMYGYYLNSFGVPFKYYEALGMTDGIFKGSRLRSRLSLLERLLNRVCERSRAMLTVRRKLFTWRDCRRVTGGFRLK